MSESACLIQTGWDYAGSAASGRLSTPFQAYRIVRHQFTGFDILTTRNKVRGRGGSFFMRMDTEAGKDCQIVGWNLAVAGNPIV